MDTYARKQDYKAPPCPNCGADAEVDFGEISVRRGKVEYYVTMLTCSARCFERDLEGYLNAVNDEAGQVSSS